MKSSIPGEKEAVIIGPHPMDEVMQWMVTLLLKQAQFR